MGWFFKGRAAWLWLPTLWLAALAGWVRLWPVAMLFDSLPDRLLRAIGAGEAIGVVCAAASVWLLAPRMATWELSAPSRPRRLAAACLACVLAAYACLGPLARWLVWALPDGIVPRTADGMTARSQFIEPPTVLGAFLEPRALDVAAVAAGLALGVGLLGRVAGTLAGAAWYLAVVIAQGSAALCRISPYGVCAGTDQPDQGAGTALAAVATLSAAAVATWWRTGAVSPVGALRGL
ncbi:MAG: hypothetical protein LBO20_04850 [Bifidobacteriaceae bacterium]|nr:hypothetical protein [Bifidobacteriaceae bacterium]